MGRSWSKEGLEVLSGDVAGAEVSARWNKAAGQVVVIPVFQCKHAEAICEDECDAGAGNDVGALSSLGELLQQEIPVNRRLASRVWLAPGGKGNAISGETCMAASSLARTIE